MSQGIVEQLLLALAMGALLLLPLYWNRVLGLATSMTRTGGLLHDGDLGLAEIHLPPGWKGTTIPNVEAPIQATDRLGRRYLVISSESREDFTDEMDLERFREIAFLQLMGSSRILEIHGPEARTVGEFAALQTEALLATGKYWMTRYLHTAIAGDRAFHQVIAWTAPSTYDRPLFDQLLAGFRERPGPTPVVRPAPTSKKPSQYDVH